jgi:hypothetical protein
MKREKVLGKLNILKYLLPIIAIVAVFFMAGYTYSWFIGAGGDLQSVIELRAAAKVNLTFTVDGEDQQAPVGAGSQVRRFNGQRAVDYDNLWISDDEDDDFVYIASYPMIFFIVDPGNLGIEFANLEITISNVRVKKYVGEELVINEHYDNDTLIKPEELFTWEIIWNETIIGPYGIADEDFYIEPGDPTVPSQLPYRTNINCLFNLIYIGQETYWAERYRTEPTETEYQPLPFSDNYYKGCRFEFSIACSVT